MSRSRIEWTLTVCWLLFGLQLSTPIASAAPPPLDYLFPAGAQAGINLAVIAGGKFDSWPVRVWIDGSGLEFTVKETNGQFAVAVAPDALPGPRLVRFYSDGGASKPRIFVVGSLPEINEIEPNDGSKQAQALAPLPMVVNGRLEKAGDADSFAIELGAGECLVAAMDAYAIGSPVDAHLHLFDSGGVRVAFNHDHQTLDPLLTYTAVKGGRFVLQVAGFAHPPAADIRFVGNASAVYRLTMTTGPFVDHAFPAGLQRGHTGVVECVGWNLGSNGEARAREVSAAAANALDSALAAALPWPPGRLNLALGDEPEITETEPEDGRPQHVTPPVLINGRIDPAGDQDAFGFSARKGERWLFSVESARLGFPLDGQLKLEGAGGKELARDDDTGEGDPVINWTAPEDQTNVLRLADLFGEGGAAYVYRLRIARAVSDFGGTLGEDSIRVEAGKNVELKLAVKRQRGHTNELTVRVEGLPEQITVTNAPVPANDGEVKLTFSAGTNAVSAQVPLQVWLVESSGESPRRRIAGHDLHGEEPRGNLLINQNVNPWLTVLASPAPAKPEAKKADP